MVARLAAHKALVLTALLTACALPPDAQPGEPSPQGGRGVIRVQNNNFYDMTVYVVQSGMRWRLGTVTGFSEQAFPVPSSFNADVRDVQLLADPIGGGPAYLSQRVRIHPGQAVELSIAGSINLSSLAVWRSN